jgi:3-phenylpropionate/cinnamic acid dioxygenase small subunit
MTMDDELAARVHTVLDQQEIHDLLMRYTRGVDRKDIELVLSTFHDDAIDDHGSWKGPETINTGRIAADEVGQTMHFVGNQLIEVDGDVAFAESYFISYRTIEEGGKTFTRIRAGRYLDRVERRDGVWKIAHRLVVDDWSRVDEVVAVVEGVGVHKSLRSRDDLVYRLNEVTSG